ncbi:MAG TPA: U32 family peptidase [Clostridiales bacterium]|nr:U32 family peptidase [Clostridiales bacterium]
MAKITPPELLSPAGDLAMFKAAVDYGADAVYLSGEEYGMRASAKNFSLEEMAEGLKYAHSHGVKVYVTCNTLPHNEEIKRLPQYLEQLNSLGVDAIIASDFGTINLIKRYAPNVKLHISVQSGIVNYETARAFYDMGASRIVVARELSLEEIKEIRDKTPKDLEIEAFVHGAVCVSFSARCLLSSYLTGRDANRGDCAQPCRWSYSLVEQKRPGEFYDITETENGTYILNANDLCMVEHIPELIAAGIDSFKIEGRAKSHYYVAVTTNAYRAAIDSYISSRDNWKVPEWIQQELNKISHREYSKGFYFGKPKNAQTYKSGGYIRDYQVGATVEGYENGMLVVKMKNKFSKGQEFDCLEPGSKPFVFTVKKMYDETGEEIESAPHPEMIVKIPYPVPIKPGSMLRMKIN